MWFTYFCPVAAAFKTPLSFGDVGSVTAEWLPASCSHTVLLRILRRAITGRTLINWPFASAPLYYNSSFTGHGKSFYSVIYFMAVLARLLSSEPNIMGDIIQSYLTRFNRWHLNGSAYCTEKRPNAHHGWKINVAFGSEHRCENRSSSQSWTRFFHLKVKQCSADGQSRVILTCSTSALFSNVALLCWNLMLLHLHLCFWFWQRAAPTGDCSSPIVGVTLGGDAVSALKQFILISHDHTSKLSINST